jgi:hypothetical protein
VTGLGFWNSSIGLEVMLKGDRPSHFASTVDLQDNGSGQRLPMPLHLIQSIAVNLLHQS